MDSDILEKKAIEAAINGTWFKALSYNLQLVKKKPNDISSLNRLARAYWELGKIDKAKSIYKKTLTIDPYNSIAIKNLQRLSKTKKFSNKKQSLPVKSLFLEEPGKTKTVRLVKLASNIVLSELNNGQIVQLIPKKRSIIVVNEKNAYLGTLPDDLSLRLIKMIEGGNKYQAIVKSVDRQYLEIFIREIFRSKRFHNSPSFPSSRYSPDNCSSLENKQEKKKLI